MNMATKTIFHKLAENGKTHCDKDTNNWQAAGLALAEISYSKWDITKLFYAFCEDHNQHALCSLINWVVEIYDTRYMDDLNNIKWLFANREYIINVKRDDNTGEWTTKKYRAVVTFEEVE